MSMIAKKVDNISESWFLVLDSVILNKRREEEMHENLLLVDCVDI
jgi:hypothetical protein